MGSKTKKLDRRIRAAERGKGLVRAECGLDERPVAKRHKCPACGEGGHRRRTPNFGNGRPTIGRV